MEKQKRTIQEQKALDEVVRKLLERVLEQEHRIGYLFWKHLEIKNDK
jgi:hypothetical protein